MANTAYNNLKQFIKRKLGSPVINIEITDDQLEDAIDESLNEFHENHFSGAFIGYLPLTLQENVIEYQLQDNVQEILQIISSDDLSFNWNDDEPLLLKSFYVGNENYPIYSHGVVDVEVYRQQFKLYTDYFDVPILFNYNTPSHKLFLYTQPKENLDVFLKVFHFDEDDITHYLNDKWVKKYATALARLQWGRNLMKYNGANLPGGSAFNSDGIISEAKEDIAELKEELWEKYTLPPLPQIG